MKVKAYEGKEKFIFVSYAHKDSEQVLRMIEKMQDRGYRVWYDEGIAPGSEWPENIAQHLNESAVVIAFISANSLASSNCRREITFAFSKHKAFLGVVLEKVEMSLGMEMQLSAQQCIFRYNYDTEDEFLEKVLACPDLNVCKEMSATKPIEIMQPKVSEEEPVVPKITEQKNVKATKYKKNPLQGAYIKSHALQIGIGCGVAAFIAFISLLIGVIAYNRVEITPNKVVGRGERYLTILEEEIGTEQIQQINKLKKLKTITFENCIFSEDAMTVWEQHPYLSSFSIKGGNPISDFDFLHKQSGLESLMLQNCGVADANFNMKEYSGLKYIYLADNSEFTDLTLLNCSLLRKADISGTGVTDLSPLKEGELLQIDFSDTKVSDVTVLGDISGLKIIDGSNSLVEDITPLASLQGLKEMYFNNCQIQSITEKMLSLEMEKIGLANNGLQDCSGLEYFTVLQEVDLAGNMLSETEFLSKNTATLVQLDISDNPLDEDAIAFLEYCLNLEKLYMNKLHLTNLDFVRNMKKLKTLYAQDCGITDISALSGASALENVYLAFNQISDLRGLSNLSSKYGATVDLAYNLVTQTTGLPAGKYSLLVLIGNKLSYDGETFKDISGTDILLDFDAKVLESDLAEDSFYYYYFNGCPEDKKLQVIEKYGKYKTKFVQLEGTEESLRETGIDYSQLMKALYNANTLSNS